MLYLFLPGKRIYDISLFDHSFCYFLNVIFRRFSYAFFDAFFFNAVYTLSLLLLYRFIIVSGWLLYGLDCANLTLSTSSLTLCITYIYDFFPLFLFTLFMPFLLLFSFPMNCQVFYCIFYVLVTVFMPFSSPFFLSNESVQPFFTHFLRTFYAFYAFSSPFSLSNELSSFFLHFLRSFYGFYAFSFPFFLSNESVQPVFTHFLRTFYAFSSPFFLSNEQSSFFLHF